MRPKNTSLVEVIESFILARHDLKDRTRSGYQKVLLGFDRKWLHGGALSDLTRQNVDAYLASKRRAPYAARLEAAVLKSFASWLAEQNILRSEEGGSVLGTLKIPRVPKEGRRPFSDEDMRLILRVIGEGPNAARDRAMVLTQVSSGGARLNELRELRRDDIDLRRLTVTYRGETSKSSVTRVARLDPAAASALDTYIRDWRPRSADDHVFLTLAGRAFKDGSFGNVYARMRDRLRKAGFKGFMSHRLRHTWATNGHRVGMTVFDLQEEGGWKDTEMVRRYAKGRPFHELQQMPTPFSGIFGGDPKRVSGRPNQLPFQRVS